ncbi:MAG: hypothetical protein F7B95_02330 [Desulfurococcales archaeon]|nr:hypothetical protein [Desulfurococcales archaeon]
MAARGVGVATGLHGITAKHALILDSEEAFNNIKRTLEGALSEFTGYPGFKITAGRTHGQNVLLVLVPPFPAAVYETVSELVMFGVRRIVAVIDGFKSRRGIAEDSVLIASAAVPRDSISRRISLNELPLTASVNMVLRVKEALVSPSYGDFNYYIGFTLTVDTPRIAASDSETAEYLKVKQIIGVDTITAPLYAFQFLYPSLEALSVIVLNRNIHDASVAFEETLDKYERVKSRSSRMITMIALALLKELFK